MPHGAKECETLSHVSCLDGPRKQHFPRLFEQRFGTLSVDTAGCPTR